MLKLQFTKNCIPFTDVELEVNGNTDGGAERSQGHSHGRRDNKGHSSAPQ